MCTYAHICFFWHRHIFWAMFSGRPFSAWKPPDFFFLLCWGCLNFFKVEECWGLEPGEIMDLSTTDMCKPRGERLFDTSLQITRRQCGPKEKHEGVDQKMMKEKMRRWMIMNDDEWWMTNEVVDA